MVTESNLSQKSEPANDTDLDAIPQKVFQNISINIPNETFSNPNENINDKSNFNEGVFFATPVNVTDEMNNALVNQDLKEEHVTRSKSIEPEMKFEKVANRIAMFEGYIDQTSRIQSPVIMRKKTPTPTLIHNDNNEEENILPPPR